METESLVKERNSPSQNCFCDPRIRSDTKLRCRRLGKNSSKAICFTSRLCFSLRVSSSGTFQSEGEARAR